MTSISFIRDNITGKKLEPGTEYYSLSVQTRSVHNGNVLHSTFHVIEYDHLIGIIKNLKNVVRFEVNIGQCY